MRIIISILLLFSFGNLFGQCESCPEGTPVTLNADFGAGTYNWVCTNGFTSTDSMPSITPENDVTCYLTFTNGICTALDTVTVDVCSCPVNNPCVNLNYNAGPETVTITNTGTNNSPVATDTVSYRYLNPTGPWTNVVMPATLSGCTIMDYIDASPSVAVVSGLFKLRLNNLTNKCGTPCDLKVIWVFPNYDYNTENILVCGTTTTTEYSISVSGFQDAGYIAKAFLEMETDYGTVVNEYRFSFIGAGPYPDDVLAETIVERQIYRDIEVRRLVTYSDGCPSENCFVPLDIPNQPPGDCTNFIGIINAESGCGDFNLIGTFYNGATPITYQWKYNGSPIIGQTTNTLCMAGRPPGSYCLNAIDANDCTFEVCSQGASCNTTVSIAVSTTLLQANVVNCGSPTFQWSQLISGVWTEISGATSANYNTMGVTGWYSVSVVCGSCFASASVLYLPPCNASSSISVSGESATVTVTGCNGTNITYIWEYFDGSSWNTIFSTSTTLTTLGVGFSEGNALYRIRIACQDCIHESQYDYSVPNPCQGFTASINGVSSLCNNGTSNYTVTVNGTGPYDYIWNISGVEVGTENNFNFEPTSNGVYVLILNIEDSNGCTFTANKIITVTTCCTLTSTVDPTSLDICTNEFFSINGNYSGNQGSVTFGWTASRNGEPEVFLGTDQTLINVFSLSGTYTIVFTVTDASGCQSQNTVIASVRVCTNCFCSATLTQGSGCTLYGLFIGAGCSNFEYQLQYSATGTGWTTVLTGVAGNGSNFLSGASENGFYRLVVNSEICAGFTTPIVTIDCVQECGCEPGPLVDNGCQMVWNETECDGYLATLQVYVHPNWEFASFESPYEYEQLFEGCCVFRVAYQKAGCDIVYSDTVQTGFIVNEFSVTPVSPAPLGYVFDRDVSTDPVLEDLVADCAPYDGYILGGTSNTWDVVISSVNDINWSYTHYDAGISGNIFEVSRTSNSIRFQVKGAYATCGCGAQPPIPLLCGIPTVNAMLRLVGKDECENVIFDRILLKYINN